MEKRLYLDKQHKVIGGVCAGLAEYFGIDVSIVRVLFLVTFIFKGSGGLIYLILWAVLPKKPFGSVTPGVDYVVQPQDAGAYTPGYSVRPSNGRYLGGMLLILIGLLFLLNEFDIIPDIEFEYFWPTALIVVGLIFIFSSRHKTPLKNDPFDQQPPQL